MKTLIKEIEPLLINKVVMDSRVIAILMVLLSSQACRTSGNDTVSRTERTIQVAGSSEMIITPNEIEFVIGITDESWYGQSTKKQMRRIGKSEQHIRKLLTELGVNSKDISSELSMQSYWWWYENRNSEVNKEITFKVNDFSIINEFVAQLDIKGVRYMRLGNLSHKKIREFRKKVKSDAILAAKEKAAYLLEGLNKKTGDIINVIELPDANDNGQTHNYGGYSNNVNLLSNSTSYSDPNSTSLNNTEIKSIRIRYEIQATFEIIN